MSALTQNSAFAPRAIATSRRAPRAVTAPSSLTALLKSAGSAILAIAVLASMVFAALAIRFAIYFPQVAN